MRLCVSQDTQGDESRDSGAGCPGEQQRGASLSASPAVMTCCTLYVAGERGHRVGPAPYESLLDTDFESVAHGGRVAPSAPLSC